MFKQYGAILCLVLLVNKSHQGILGDLPILGDLLESSDATHSCFCSPSRLQERDYSYELKLRPETCAVQIGFESFSFGQPIKNGPLSAFSCATDASLVKLSVLNLLNVNLLPSLLCGEMTGQKIIYPVSHERLLDVSLLRTITLTASLTNLANLLPSALPSWNITMTQIPCPDAVQCPPKTPKPEAPQLPKLSLPPPGCLQYFTETEGIVESFNFLGKGSGSYFGGLNYAICFRRLPQTCGLKLTPLAFGFGANDNVNQYTERDCDTIGALGIKAGLTAAVKDYLLIPNAVVVDAEASVSVASKFCGKALRAGSTVYVITPGPLSLNVVTDSAINPLESGLGFRFKYELLSNCENLY